jgi:hypothetical protein
LRKTLLIVLTMIPLAVFSQFGQSDHVQILGGKCQLLDYQNKLKPDFSIDARRTLFQREWAAVMGLKFGVEYRRVHRLGIGVYFLNTRVFDEVFEPEIPGIDKLEYEFNYSTLYYDRVLFFNRKWEFGSTLHLGGGKIRAFYRNPENQNDRIEIDSQDFSTVELSVYGEYNILFWLGVGLGTGYRQVLGAGSDLNSDFSNPIFVVNLQVKMFKLARSFYDESAKNEF